MLIGARGPFWAGGFAFWETAGEREKKEEGSVRGVEILEGQAGYSETGEKTVRCEGFQGKFSGVRGG